METRQIGSVDVVTDSETNQEFIGDIEGGFSETDLLKHIRTHGHQQLCETLTYMQWQIWDALRQINTERDKAIPVNAGPGA